MHGTANIPKRCTYDCRLPGIEGRGYHYRGNLGLWLTTQRQAKKGKITNKISAERLAKLQVLVDKGMMAVFPKYMIKI